MFFARRHFIFLAAIAVLLAPFSVGAKSHYSFELEEELTPLIEWRAYGPEAFAEAAFTGKPIFMLLTAPSWCYWCQVYGSDEYLYNEKVYPYINEHFIPVYIDADKRQDLTRQYLEGGWPSTTIMAPNRERIHGYSGPRPIPTMLENLERAVAYAAQGGFATLDSRDKYKATEPRVPTDTALKRISTNFIIYSESSFENTYGGFGSRQKFPQPRTLMAFLDMYVQTGEFKWMEMIEKTLENQYTKIEEIETNYNLFDPIEGGFHRYGTQLNWTPPHYEKMLYDNSAFLQMYARVADITGNELAREVSDATFAFLQSWYDEERGGFAANSDAFDEEHYYGVVDRDAEKPRVEWTKYTDWNSDAMIAFFDLGQRREDPEALKMASTTLTFFLENMVDDHGPYHYMSPDGTKGVQGSIIDSAALLVASMDGYNAVGDATFLDGAKRIADYALDTLYDWNSGGFFERNSPDTDLYAPDELLLISKPVKENGMMTYGLLLLYEQTNDATYLTAAVRTLGYLRNASPSLDRGFYLHLAAQEALRQDVLTQFAERLETINRIEKDGRDAFFMNTGERTLKDVVKREPFVPAKESDSFDASMMLLLLIAFMAGILSFLSPCTLPILPAYLAAVFKTQRSQQQLMSVSFLAGLASLFTLFGISSTYIGILLRENLSMVTQIAGVIIVIFGVMLLAGKGLRGVSVTPKTPTTCIGAFLFGAVLGISWTPCVGPILLAIIAIASTLDGATRGGALLFSYAIGLGLPLVVFSSVLQKLPKEGRVWRSMRMMSASTSRISGVLFIVIGALIYSGTLYTFNKYVASTALQTWFFSAEQWLLGIVQ